MKKIIFSLLLSLIGTLGHSQNSLQGVLSDSSNGQPLEQVSIYFPDLQKGSVSDHNGAFMIANLPQGTYKIVASYLGFQSFSENITILKGDNQFNIALTPTAIEMEEIIVSTPFHKLQRDNVMKVEYAKIATLKVQGATTLAEGITHIPGVSVVSTGTGIGKPMIRGLTANRVLVYAQGLRLENQQFGDEHGLGVNEAGIESVEVIKGPASLLYGSDAMGGVLYLNPEKFAAPNTLEGDVNLGYFSNSQGWDGNIGLRTSGKNMQYLVRAASNTHTDYRTGSGERVTNSRFKENDLKFGTAYQTTSFRTELRYNYNRTDLGIPEELEGPLSGSRTPEVPYQEINNHLLSSNSKLFLQNSSLELTLGYLLNTRKEFEETDHATMELDLATFQYNLRYTLPKWKKLESIIGIQGMHQTNTNFGEEVLIPDAITNDFGVLATTHVHFNPNNDLQLGIRYDHRSLSGEAHGLLEGNHYIPKLQRDFNSMNAAIGYKNNLTQTITGRLNIASGYRAPNLAELTSNGVHEGTNRYELGNLNLKNEQNLQIDLGLEFNNDHLEFFVNGFYNTIADFVYLAPDGTWVQDHAVYQYRQQNADLYGGEIGLHLHPHPYDWLHFESSFQTVVGKLNQGGNLPLMPANNLTNTLRAEWDRTTSWLGQNYIFVSLNSVFEQSRIGAFETPSKGYNLLNLGLGGRLSCFDQQIDLRIAANNLLDKAYISHLSRLKVDEIQNPGRNISLALGLRF